MSEKLKWFKSSHSDDEGGNCLEVALDWHKSSYSDFEDASCVEIAVCPTTVHIRDSKLPAGAAVPTLAVGPGAWSEFVAHQIHQTYGAVPEA